LKQLTGRVEIDDSYLGGERSGGTHQAIKTVVRKNNRG